MAKGSGTTRAGSASAPRGLVTGSENSLRGFLLGYKPADEHFTSNEEIELVTNRLGLRDLNESETNSLRNRVVSIYRNAMDKEIKYDENGDFAGRTEKYWDYSTAMQSVTAVIDYVKVRKGMEV